MNETCRYCSKPVTAEESAVTVSYWQGGKFICHKACKVDGEKAEALECQTIDADCNDCRHFQRGKMQPLPAHIQKHIVEGKCPGFTSGVFDGHCLKFDRPTLAYPKKWTGRECFEHRRAIIPPN